MIRIAKSHRWLFPLTLTLLVIDLTASSIWFSHVKNQITYPIDVRCQSAIVFMGNFTDHYTRLGKQTKRRLNHALNLFQSGSVDSLLCTGGARPRDNVYGADMMKEYLMGYGVPEEKIITDLLSYDTRTNLTNSLKIIKKEQWKTVCLVSSPLHLYRIQGMLPSRSTPTVFTPTPYPYESANPAMSLLEIWKNIHHEWIAYALYLLPDAMVERIVLLIRPGK